jgi:hypothetical protein
MRTSGRSSSDPPLRAHEVAPFDDQGTVVDIDLRAVRREQIEREVGEGPLEEAFVDVHAVAPGDGLGLPQCSGSPGRIRAPGDPGTARGRTEAFHVRVDGDARRD